MTVNELLKEISANLTSDNISLQSKVVDSKGKEIMHITSESQPRYNDLVLSV